MSRTTKTLIYNYATPLIMLLTGVLLYGQEIPENPVDVEADASLIKEMVTTLQAEQLRSDSLVSKMIIPGPVLTHQDSLDLKARRKQQAAIRARMDILTMQLLWISERLQDPRTRTALAKKLKSPSKASAHTEVKSIEPEEKALPAVSARMIDLAAVPLIREEGLSLDQARLQVVEALTLEQVSQYYASLSREDRYKLYDIIDATVQSKTVDFNIARKSAIFFQLYAN